MKKQIEIKRLRLENFKGIRSLELDLNHVVSIMGQNGTGKSTIADSWSWLLHGKDSEGRSDSNFAIKTLDADNNVLPKINHTVEAVLDVDGEEVTLKRTLQEKWIKSRGALETTFQGNETLFEWNDVPMRKKDYEDKINSLIDESVAKLISNPLAFNALPWQDQRNILISIVGEVDDTDIAKGNKDFEGLLAKLSNKDLEEYKKELAAKRKKLNEAIRDIPSRIDEVTKTKPESHDWSALEKESARIVENIDKVDSEIEDRNKALESQNKARQEKSDQIYKLKTRNQNIEFEIKKEMQQAESSKSDPTAPIKRDIQVSEGNLASYKNVLSRLKSELSSLEEELKNVSVNRMEKREEWQAENARELKFDADKFECPACKRPLEADDIEAEKERMRVDFNTDKAKSLELINTQGGNLKNRQEELEKSVSSLEKRLADGKAKVKETEEEIAGLQKKLEAEEGKGVEAVDTDKLLEEKLANSKEHFFNKKEIAELQDQLENTKEGVDVSDLKAKKTELNGQLSEVTAKLSHKQQIEKVDARAKELEADEKKYAQQIADIEKEQFVAQEFTTKKVADLEDRINQMFNGPVSIKMFKDQIDGVIPWCTVLVNGIPFADANTAGRVNAGLSIINVLGDYYGVCAPVFIDGRESVTNLVESDSQIINLIVSENHQTLTVI